jgi:large subunit ribosomal protein L35
VGRLESAERTCLPLGGQKRVAVLLKRFREETFVAKKVKKLKLKTHRGAAKRFKITATGKVMRMHSGKRHLLGTKKANRMRRLKKMKQVHPADAGNVHKMLPYG